MQLLVATQNPGKKKEFAEILASSDVELVFLDELKLDSFQFPEETGLTFSENAQIKAQSLAEFSGIDTIADDSGLCVKALDGFPGVVSARWLEGRDEDRVAGLLKKLKDSEDRSAYFETSISMFKCEAVKSYFFTGKCEGSIAQEPKGSNGFGYDSVFIPNGYTQSFAELDSSTKNKISHRYIALNKLSKFVKSNQMRNE